MGQDDATAKLCRDAQAWTQAEQERNRAIRLSAESAVERTELSTAAEASRAAKAEAAAEKEAEERAAAAQAVLDHQIEHLTQKNQAKRIQRVFRPCLSCSS